MSLYIQTAGSLAHFPAEATTVNSIPTGVWRLCWSKDRGNYLIPVGNPSTVKLRKVYGNHHQRARKAVSTYIRRSDKPTGIILSGVKGSGKSVTQLLMSQELLDLNVPTIIVDSNIPGIIPFIEAIEQEVLVLFDEFEKIFEPKMGVDGDSPVELRQGDVYAQEDFLTLFDGVSGRHHLYAVSVNNIDCLTSFMLARPGRFFYHYTYAGVTHDILDDYIQNEMPDMPASGVVKMKLLAFMHTLTFDMLAAIAEDFNAGFTVEEILEDLNIFPRENDKESQNTEKRFLAEVVEGDGLPQVLADEGIFFTDFEVLSLNYSSGRIQASAYAPNDRHVFVASLYFSLEKTSFEDGVLFIPWEAFCEHPQNAFVSRTVQLGSGEQFNMKATSDYEWFQGVRIAKVES